MWCNKGCLLLIRLEHRDLMIFEEGVQEGEHPMIGDGIDYLIYLG